jgi:hypothetical protein
MENPRFKSRRPKLVERRYPPCSLVKAISVGALIDFVGSLAIAAAFGIVYSSILLSQGMSEDSIRRTLEALTPWSGIGLLVSALTLPVSIFAGYKTAVIANRATYLAPGIVAVISCGLNAMVVTAEPPPRFALAVMSIVNVITFLGGAYIHIRKLPTTLNS